MKLKITVMSLRKDCIDCMYRETLDVIDRALRHMP